MTTTSPATPPFVVTVSLPDLLPASRLQPGDTFAFPDTPTPLIVLNTHREHDYSGFLRLDLDGQDQPLCIRETEDIRPLCLPRTYELTCPLCDHVAKGRIDIAAYGEPRILVCRKH
ncbi:hypothetical protein ACQEVX_05470 [Streptomyces syringium]|uniref:hypothetical protein n=1 Tax=Streptomyces syringium TaxID=76729 RepID=UPI003D8DCBFA